MHDSRTAIAFKRLSDTALVPTRATSGSAGFDLYADLHTAYAKIAPGDTVMIHTGISVAIPDGYFGAVFARSGLAVKRGLRPANCVGVIDSDYRGEIIVALHNDNDTTCVIEDDERVAQLVILPYLKAEFVEKDELPITVRGTGGFGSTGT